MNIAPTVDGGASLQLAPPDRDVLITDLFEQHYSVMVLVSRRVVLNESLAEEVVQDAFVDLYDRWESVSNPPAYLRTTVINRSRRVVRRRILGNELHEQIGSRLPSPAERPYLVDMLHRLNDRHRAAVFMAYFMGWTRAEIGEALGCSEGTAKSLVWRGVDQLRHELGQPEPSERPSSV